ncbi:MAG: S41 family peptidase, partial [Rhodothermales bacterium]|nr:S41 family peptidase [Rhodothermales bacterium]
MTGSCSARPLVFALLLASVNVAASAQTDTISVERKIAGLSLIWQEANYNFAHFALRPELDWNAAFEQAIGRVIATKSDYDYVRELQRFLALLGEAHTNMEPGPGFRETHGGHPAVELEEIERRPVVVNMDRELAEEIPLGSVITAVDGVPYDKHLAEHVFPYLSTSTEHYRWRAGIRGNKWRAVGLLVGDVGTIVRLTIETPDGAMNEVDLERIEGGAVVDWQHARRSDAPILEFRRLDDGILYFALNTFNEGEIVTEFEKHLDELASARAVVLDVRNNGGGNSSNGWHIGKYFSDVPLQPSHWRTRENRASYKAWGRFSDNP